MLSFARTITVCVVLLQVLVTSVLASPPLRPQPPQPTPPPPRPRPPSPTSLPQPPWFRPPPPPPAPPPGYAWLLPPPPPPPRRPPPKSRPPPLTPRSPVLLAPPPPPTFIATRMSVDGFMGIIYGLTAGVILFVGCIVWWDIRKRRARGGASNQLASVISPLGASQGPAVQGGPSNNIELQPVPVWWGPERVDRLALGYPILPPPQPPDDTSLPPRPGIFMPYGPVGYVDSNASTTNAPTNAPTTASVLGDNALHFIGPPTVMSRPGDSVVPELALGAPAIGNPIMPLIATGVGNDGGGNALPTTDTFPQGALTGNMGRWSSNPLASHPH